MRNMSFMLTEPQYLDGTKDVTRRMGWGSLKVGDEFRAVRKAMGLKKGEKQVVLGINVVTAVNWEELKIISKAEVIREGFPEMSPAEFVAMYCKHHKGCTPETKIRRIAFKKLLLT